ncbi:hypothetical protein [Pararhodobacter sp. CCB-MM2]|uniref:hypothetical protein n=1 Tax=Pararhodobacter sp. CCB-MM2 TaxID=1786003 RepID=UPI00082CB331|nr:hypothetical protein [Pararhodobacter sp. CCB-MM2]
MFFQMLAEGVEGHTGEEEAAFLKRVNADLAKQENPYTIEKGDLGTLMIYPYATPSDDRPGEA